MRGMAHGLKSRIILVQKRFHRVAGAWGAPHAPAQAIRNMTIMILSIFLLASSAHAEWSAAQISNELAPSVVKIVSLDRKYRPLSFGTGFFLDSNGLLVTNHHVLLGGSRGVVKTLDHRMGEVLEILNDDPKLDLLIARTSLRRTKPLTLGDSAAIRPGDKIFCLGYPEGFQVTVSRGMVSALRKAEDIDLLQITARILPGYSGGPVFDSNGNVIGIATSFIDLGQDLNFAMPIHALKNLRPVRLGLSSLSGMPARLEAAMRDNALTEILVMRDRASPERPSPPEAPVRSKDSQRTVGPQPAPGPGTVYFKSGKGVLCDRAWKEGETVFLVMHNKKVAVGYDEKMIDMQRSFLPSF